ncbi:MAG TPA: hypothetical protein P5243_07210 [Bacteroidales bacterium]|nr:hypothetical protein [Bacteroidales bacterium]
MNVKINFFVSVLLLFAISCKEDSAIKHVTYTIDQSTKEWYIADSITLFTMIDSKGIESSFNQISNYVDYSPGKTIIMGIPTKASKTEQKYQSYSSTYGIPFSVSFYPHSDGYGDHIYINIKEYSCSFDLIHQKVTTVYTPFGSVSLSMTDKGYKNLDKVSSTGEILSEYTVQNKTYTSVLHITLLDCIPNTEPYAIREILYAQKYGLIEFVYANGEKQERIFD